MLTRLQIERWAPLFVGALASVAWRISDGEIAGFFAKELLGALLSAAAIAAGFLTTALSILLPLASMQVGKRLKSSGYLPYLHQYLRRALYGCLTLSAICIICFLSLKENSAVNEPLSTIIIFLASYAAAALVRIAEILINLFQLASEPEDKNG